LRPAAGAPATGASVGRIATAIVVGGRLSTALRDELLRDLCSKVLVAYGSAEAGETSLGDARHLDRHPGIVGRVFDDIEVEIVDAAGVPVPREMAGRLRVRTRNAVSGYLDDPAASAEHFRDGWFYSGDMARLSRARTLTVLDRLVDSAGERLLGKDIDAAVLRLPGVQDACAISLPRKDGGFRLAIAVAGRIEDVIGIAPAIREALPTLPPFSVVPVSAVPRNPLGKANRKEFARLIAQRLVDPASAQASDGFVLLRRPALH
jgi:acyl-CoA synthetase (AMP-forming)/AMP-acid ligase II